MSFKKSLEKILKNKELKSNGEYLGIPYPFKRLNNYLCSIDRGQAIGILGRTGDMKSKITRYIFLYHAFKFHIETGYKLRILFFCMEDSVEQVYNFIICNYLKEKYGISISAKSLHSKDIELSDDIAAKLCEANKYFENFEEIVSFIEGVTEPTAMYNICRESALALGKVTKRMEIVDGKEVEQFNYESDTHVICIFDNMSNIDTEDGTSNDQAAILKFIKDYMRLKLCNFFKFTCVMVLQMDFESEKASFNKNGETIVSKLEPSLGDIGDSKRAARSLHLVLSVFSPDRFGIDKFPIPPKHQPEMFYRIDTLGNRFRSLRVLKSNHTDTGMRIGIIADAVGETFKELPLPNTPEIQALYDSLEKQGHYQKIEQPQQNIINYQDDGEEPPF